MGPSSGGIAPFGCLGMPPATSLGISRSFPRLSPSGGLVTHALLPRSPVYSEAEAPFRPRLACLIHAANVRSEPGSNPSHCCFSDLQRPDSVTQPAVQQGWRVRYHSRFDAAYDARQPALRPSRHTPRPYCSLSTTRRYPNCQRATAMRQPSLRRIVTRRPVLNALLFYAPSFRLVKRSASIFGSCQTSRLPLFMRTCHALRLCRFLWLGYTFCQTLLTRF